MAAGRSSSASVSSIMLKCSTLVEIVLSTEAKPPDNGDVIASAAAFALRGTFAATSTPTITESSTLSKLSRDATDDFFLFVCNQIVRFSCYISCYNYNALKMIRVIVDVAVVE